MTTFCFQCSHFCCSCSCWVTSSIICISDDRFKKGLNGENEGAIQPRGQHGLDLSIEATKKKKLDESDGNRETDQSALDKDQDDVDVNHTMLKTLKKVDGKVTMIQTDLGNFLRQNGMVSVTDIGGIDTEKGKLNFPLATMEDFHDFEEALEDDTYKLQMVSELILQGGDTPRKQCRLVLQKLLAPELAHTFNWLGRGSKNRIAFHNTQTADTVRRVMIQYGHTIQIAENEIKEFLRTSGDRFKSRFKNKFGRVYMGADDANAGEDYPGDDSLDISQGDVPHGEGHHRGSDSEGELEAALDAAAESQQQNKLTMSQADIESLFKPNSLMSAMDYSVGANKEKLNFPLGSMEEFHCFEKALEEDAYKFQMVSDMVLQGGSTPRKQCRLVLGRLLGRGLAHHFNWLGRGPKNRVAFCNTQTADVLRRVMIQHGHTTQIAEQEIKEFLRTSGDRFKSRMNARPKDPGYHPFPRSGAEFPRPGADFPHSAFSRGDYPRDMQHEGGPPRDAHHGGEVSHGDGSHREVPHNEGPPREVPHGVPHGYMPQGNIPHRGDVPAFPQIR